jgi:ankyrin repeat protein
LLLFNKNIYFQVKMSAELDKACEIGDVATAQACLAGGGNDNDKYDGKTPLITAVFYNNKEIVRILLAGDDVDIAATTGYVGYMYTALHWACYDGYAECVALLGQDRRMTSRIINIKNLYGQTALMLAVERTDLSCVKRMVELDGVDWETKNNNGVGLEDVARWVFAIG